MKPKLIRALIQEAFCRGYVEGLQTPIGGSSDMLTRYKRQKPGILACLREWQKRERKVAKK